MTDPSPSPVLKSGVVLAMEAADSPPPPAWRVLLEAMCLLDRADDEGGDE